MTHPQRGINLRELNRLIRELGGTAEPIRRTGEIRYSHPLMANRPKANSRRKDAPLHLVEFVQEVVRRRTREIRRNGPSAEGAGTTPKYPVAPTSDVGSRAVQPRPSRHARPRAGKARLRRGGRH